MERFVNFFLFIFIPSISSINRLFLVSGGKGPRLVLVLIDKYLQPDLSGAISANFFLFSWQKWHQRDQFEEIYLLRLFLVELPYHLIPEKDHLWKLVCNKFKNLILRIFKFDCKESTGKIGIE